MRIQGLIQTHSNQYLPKIQTLVIHLDSTCLCSFMWFYSPFKVKWPQFLLFKVWPLRRHCCLSSWINYQIGAYHKNFKKLHQLLFLLTFLGTKNIEATVQFHIRIQILPQSLPQFYQVCLKKNIISVKVFSTQFWSDSILWNFKVMGSFDALKITWWFMSKLSFVKNNRCQITSL